MTRPALGRVLALGAITGMRSMAGPAVVATAHDGFLGRLLQSLAAGEMIADKTPYVGDRTEPLPLAGRAAMGGLVGGMAARDADASVLAGAVLGAAAAVAAAHVACHLRKRFSGSPALGGVIEDALVLAIASRFVPAR